ncbi:MAG TPA: hypothetical protein VGG99_14795 [Acetobacteraceae bacterium]|jgi:hypothetical protein
MSDEQTRPAYGMLLLAAAAAAGTALSIYAYFNSEAINHTAGVLLVIATTAAMVIAALAVAGLHFLPRWLRALSLVLLLIDVIGTGIAAWFLETQLLIAFMGVALLGWLLHLIAGPRELRPLPDPVAGRMPL